MLHAPGHAGPRLRGHRPGRHADAAAVDARAQRLLHLYCVDSAVSLLHFLVLLLLHPAMYRTHRETVIVTLRVLYMLANVTNGLQTCSTVTNL